MKVKDNCIYYKGNVPCKFHKLDKRLCAECNDYKAFEKKILIIKLDALGDVVRTTSILPPIKIKYPNSQITWITKKNASILLEKIDLIDRTLSIENNYLEFILNENFDLCICLDSDPLSASILNLAKCSEKRGFITNEYGKAIPANKEAEKWWEMGVNDNLKRNNRETYQEIMYNICGLQLPAYKPIIPPKIIDHELISTFIKENKIPLDKKNIGINTGGGKRWELKKWTLENYISLIKLIKNKFPENPILLYGGPEEVAFNKLIINQVGSSVINVGCDHNLLDFISLLNVSDILITSDSLAFHLATGLGKTTIVLVGPTSPWELEVYNNGAVIYPEMDCIACYLTKCTKQPNCMQNITPEIVLKRIEELLEVS